MMEFVLFLGLCFVLGGLGVASNPSPYYGVMGLVVAAVAGCGWLVSLGVSFVSLVLVMVYLGGMLVVFVYSVSLAADPYPESWVDWGVVGYGLGMGLVVMVGLVVGGVLGVMGEGVVGNGELLSVRLDFSGVAVFYSHGVGLLLIGGWGLLLTLFVVLELVRGLSRGAIRAV
uniref:NADH-ubiquinone oxidoreductase chain 6 n=13 Tax=Lonchura TaxID=40156 RepID=A0A343QTM1_9PASE|nr:NADH dehydrogenase subunit 6 [Lonchura caniceps]YP_009444964.1 NADH dehydrogenase subunit 6 [Lonchura castaneothorax]YP_009444977.1 NADH dehydrogenase subunit 6 [Lonchura flaviprymna]YP_009444990.1 NADH dehydrogenase subunit 6 [Lonchura forbesi]YP_009445003.1 NADH dehydrogenase subunit 6 [Lonchura grandis]YP_009445016.1 NADH dehydrogenase subunit 6 [Lonchura hunsteini]YP_009445029.1 NADH dehydrogenase subunit 6 [Lonchura grandis x Lonchura castaneothorax]YP_009445055.1 NADH dehydrogenase 